MARRIEIGKSDIEKIIRVLELGKEMKKLREKNKRRREKEGKRRVEEGKRNVRKEDRRAGMDK